MRGAAEGQDQTPPPLDSRTRGHQFIRKGERQESEGVDNAPAPPDEIARRSAGEVTLPGARHRPSMVWDAAQRYVQPPVYAARRAHPATFVALTLLASGCGSPGADDNAQLQAESPRSLLRLVRIDYLSAVGWHSLDVDVDVGAANLKATAKGLWPLVVASESASAVDLSRSNATATPCWKFHFSFSGKRRERAQQTTLVVPCDDAVATWFQPTEDEKRLDVEGTRFPVDVTPFRAELEREAFRALSRSTRPPRAPALWQTLALARFLRSSIAEPRLLYAQLVQHLYRVKNTTEAAHVAAELVQFASWLEPSAAAAARHARFVPQQLPALVQQAQAGDRDAVDEILVLALEYAGDLTCFDRAVRVLFPRGLNAALDARFPPTQDESTTPRLIHTLQGHLMDAVYVADETAWKVEIK